MRRNFPRIPEKPWDFLEKFCSGTWPDQENTSNIENKSDEQRKALKNRTRYEVTKIAPSAFFGGGGRGVGLQKGG